MENALERSHVASIGKIECKCGNSGVVASSKNVPHQLPIGFRQDGELVVCEKCGSTVSEQNSK